MLFFNNKFYHIVYNKPLRLLTIASLSIITAINLFKIGREYCKRKEILRKGIVKKQKENDTNRKLDNDYYIIQKQEFFTNNTSLFKREIKINTKESNCVCSCQECLWDTLIPLSSHSYNEEISRDYFKTVQKNIINKHYQNQKEQDQKYHKDHLIIKQLDQLIHFGTLIV